MVVETPSPRTIADGLAIRRPLMSNVQAIRALVDTVMTVSEHEMVDAIAWLREREDLIAEPATAASVAALQKDQDRLGTRIALITGRNIAPELSR